MQSVSGLNVVVTGAAMGLGKLFATQAVKEGAAAGVLWDANEAALKGSWTGFKSLRHTAMSSRRGPENAKMTAASARCRSHAPGDHAAIGTPGRRRQD
jgi:NAD(P)-dependent dehydrogenase (short-subunit alcohol dehydrogenase family)